MTLPLEGVTVLDLTRVLSGPFATLQLADLGAEVIKVEHPRGGDDTRAFGPPFVEGESTYFMSVNRRKKSLALDLKHPRGTEVAHRILESADVLIENFRPGAADRLGLGAETLRGKYPRLVTCSISGYGQAGDVRYARRGGYDAVIQAASGMMALTGAPDGGPTKVGVALADMVAGLYATQGILAALHRREREGRGAHIDISMQDGMLSLLTYQAGIHFATGREPKRMGNAHPSICPYESLPTADGLYALAVGNDAQFARLARAIDRPELLADPRYASNQARVAHREALLEVLLPIFATRSTAEWEALGEAEGIPGGPVLSVSEALAHPQVDARGTVLTHQHPKAGAIRTLSSPVRLDGAQPEAGAPPPLLGQHTRELLRRYGYSEAEAEELRTDGAVGPVEVTPPSGPDTY